MTMRQPVLLLVVLLPLVALLLPACREDTAPREEPTPGCEAARTAGWLFDIASHPAPEETLADRAGGWALLYQRKYIEALGAFQRATEPEARLAAQRTQVLLGRLYRRLGHFTASSLVRYFEERDALGSDVGALQLRPFFERVSRAALGLDFERPTRGDRIPRGPYRRLLRAWPRQCPATWPAKLDVFRFVTHRLACGSKLAPSCPNVRVPKRPIGYGTRVVAYYRALCEQPKTAGLTELRMLAATPATTENIAQTVQGERIQATFAYYDPIALFVLAEVYLHRAGESAGPASREAQLISAWAAHERDDDAGLRALLSPLPDQRRGRAGFLLSEWRDAGVLEATLGEATSSNRATDETPTAPDMVDAFRAARAQYAAAVACAPSEVGRQVATELQLARGLAAGEVRRALPRFQNKYSCQLALPVLRATADRAAPDRPSWINEPGFLVRLAGAAQCMGRSAEAIGALSAVQTEYPEARAALAAAESLAVVRLMGGSVGTQRTP